MKYKREDSMGRMRSFLGFFTGLALSFFVVDAFAAEYTCTSSPKYTRCNPGYYMTSDSKCAKCPAGSYCPGETTAQQPCGSNWTSSAGAEKIEDCYRDVIVDKNRGYGTISVVNQVTGETVTASGYDSLTTQCYYDTECALPVIADQNEQNHGVTNGLFSPYYTYCGGWLSTDATSNSCPTTPTTSIKVTSDAAKFTVYAGLTGDDRSIALNGNGATNLITREVYIRYSVGAYLDSEHTNAMSTAENPITIPTRTGYEFDGYAASALACTSSTTRYIDKTGHATSDLKSYTSAALYACWVAKQITCQAGHYLTVSATCSPCTAGYYCPTKEETYVFNGVAQGRRRCSDAIGDEYTSDSGAAGIGECYINVEKGYYLAESGGAPEECTAGTYNPDSSKVYYGATSSCTLADAGYYVANTGASSQTPCSAGTYTNTTGQLSCATITNGCWGGEAATSACPNNCDTLAHSITISGTYSSETPRSANTSCRFVADAKIDPECSSITANKVSYNGTAWGTDYYTVSAKAGAYVSATGNTSAPACDSCAKGTKSEGGEIYTCEDCENKGNVASWGADACTIEKCEANYYLLGNKCVTCPDYATCDGTAEWECIENYKYDGTACVLDMFQCKAGKAADGTECTSGHYCPGRNVVAGQENDTAKGCERACPDANDGREVSSVAPATSIEHCVASGTIIVTDSKETIVTGEGIKSCAWDGDSYDSNCKIEPKTCFAGYYKTAEDSQYCDPVGNGYYRDENDSIATRHACSVLSGADGATTEEETSDTAYDCYNECTSVSIENGTSNPVKAKEYYNGTEIPVCSYTISCDYGYSADDDACKPDVYTITLDHNGGNSDVTAIYLKYGDGWYANVEATEEIESVDVPTNKGKTFRGYFYNDKLIVNADGEITGGNRYFKANATIVASWEDNPKINCDPGLYYPGTGNECLECEPGDYCEGVSEAVQDAGEEVGRKTCPSGEGTYSSASDKDGNKLTVEITSSAKAESVGACYATNVSYKPNQQTTGGQTCMYNETSKSYDASCSNVVVYACAGGYALADDTSNVCTEVGEGYYSENGETTKTQCPIYSGEERGTTASTTAVDAEDCFMNNIWFEDEKKTSGQRRKCFYVESQQEYVNCTQSVVVTCAAGYWYDASEFTDNSTVDKYCVEVGAGAWSPAQSECEDEVSEPIEAGCSTLKNTCPGADPQTKIDAETEEQMTTASSISDCVLECDSPGMYCGDNNEAIECPEGSYCTKGQQHLCDSDYPLSAKGSKKEGDCYKKQTGCKCSRDCPGMGSFLAGYSVNSCVFLNDKFDGVIYQANQSSCVVLSTGVAQSCRYKTVRCNDGYYFDGIYNSTTGLVEGDWSCVSCTTLPDNDSTNSYFSRATSKYFSADSINGSKACYRSVDLLCTEPICPLPERTKFCSYDSENKKSGAGWKFYGVEKIYPALLQYEENDYYLCPATREDGVYFECSTGYTKKENPDIDPRDGTADKPEDLCTPTVYTMTLNANDDKVYQKYKDGWYEDEAATTKLEKIPVPERENYTFTGYYTCENVGCAMVFDAEGNLTDLAKSATYTANMGLYARWDANVYDCKSGFYYVGNPDGSGSEVECKTGDKFYCPGIGKVLVTGTGCMESCPAAEDAVGDPTTTTDGATDSTACSATFRVNPANGQELANGNATWVCKYQSNTGMYSGCEVHVENCDGGYYEVSSTCAVVEGGYYSPAGETIQTQCPQKTNYKIGTDELRDAKTDCYVDCASYKPEITHSTNVYVTTGKDYRKMFWSESDEKYPECNYTVVCETGYAAVSGTAPRCDAKTYMITLDKNGGSGDIADSVSCKFDSEECALPATSVLKRTGYNSVNKWCTNKDGTGKCYAAGEISKENISADASDMTLYAIWTPAVLKIELDTSTTEEGVTVENANQGPVYLKYETGWFSDADATQPMTSIGTTLPNMENGYGFAGYKLNGVTIVDGAGTLVYSPAALTVTTTDATATVIWAATKTSCEPGYYYPGTGSKCAVCKTNHWCPGGEFETDNGEFGNLFACSEGGLSNGGVDATNIGVCYKTGMSYQTFIDGDVKRNKAMGTWTCNHETAGYTDCHEDTLEINWCAGGYWYDESQISIDCVVVGEDYWSEKGELVKHACPADGGAIYGTRVTNGGNTNGATTSDSLTDCQMRMAYATTSNTAKGSYICIAEADGEVARYGNCRLDTVEINWCAGGYWYNEEFSTTDCQEVGNNWYSAEGDMTRNACPHGGTTDVTKASQPDGNCRKTVLHPGAKYNGPDVNGVGQRGCSYESGYDGYVYGDKVSDGYVYNCAEVVMTRCEPGYWWQRGKEICEEVGQGFFGPVADPNNGNNKTGRMACPDNGLTAGTKSADATACYLERLECDITNGTGEQTRYYDRAVVSDAAGYNACFANGQAVECDTMCTITGCDSGYSLVDGACINCPADHVCTPEEGKRSCADITGGTHVKSDAGTTDAAYCYAECALDENAYEMRGRDYYGAEVADTCEIAVCSAGYVLSNGECVDCPAGMICDPESDDGEPKSCATLTGGEYTESKPNSDSIADCYKVCEPYDVVNGTAVPVEDTVYYPQECEFEGKSTNGNPCEIVDGVCIETSCNYNYEMDNGVCKPCAREHAVSYKKNGNCIVESCANGYHPNGTKCESDVVECTAPNAVTATQTWNSKQNAFGPCVITSCEDGYHLGANTCQVDEQVCELEHGVGVREWNHNTNTWGQCVATKCDPGYTNDPSQTNELWEQCGRCNNMYGANGDLAVSSYVQGCEIAACMYQGEKYALEDNECHLICDTYSDDTGTRRWNEARKKCERVCEPGYTSW